MSGIYIHIPFCKYKCNYCNFYSVGNLKNKDEYLSALIKEAELQKDYLNGKEVKTIYLGGGTPSLLSGGEINYITDKLSKLLKISDKPEVTIEANPDDVDDEKIHELRHTAVNRISIGVQSFFGEDLKYLQRRHSGIQSENAIKLMQDSGYSNISADLIYGIPTLTTKHLQYNLEKLISFDIPHISAYALTVEPMTSLEKMITQGKALPVNEDITVEHFREVMLMTEKSNYTHYEISNFCKDGMISQHNSNYWKDEEYLGLGTSAHSYNRISRQWNISNIPKYIDSIKENKILFEIEHLTESQKYNEYILLGLRTIWGCDMEYIKSHFGKDIYEQLIQKAGKYIAEESMEKKDNVLLLTQKGKILADGISAELFADSSD